MVNVEELIVRPRCSAVAEGHATENDTTPLARHNLRWDGKTWTIPYEYRILMLARRPTALRLPTQKIGAGLLVRESIAAEKVCGNRSTVFVGAAVVQINFNIGQENTRLGDAAAGGIL